MSRPSSHEAVAAADHFASLDGLRGIAILAVIGFHAELLADATGFGRIVELALDSGWIGVQLFFVLSGFLITRILLRTQSSPQYYTSFFARRMLRIFPLYYAALFVLFVVWPVLGSQPQALRDEQPVWLWLYLSNWSEPLHLGGHSVSHFWSLAVEEQFYLVWPFLIHRRTPMQVLRLCAGLTLASIAVRAGMAWASADRLAIYMFTFCRMDALALGAAAAAALQLPALRARLAASGRHLLIGAAVLSLLWLWLTHGPARKLLLDLTLGLTALALSFALLVLAAACGEATSPALWLRALSARWLRLVGKYSYAMYVIHKPLHDYAFKPLLTSMGMRHVNNVPLALLYAVALMVVAFGLAWISFHVIENPFLRLKARFAAQPEVG
jgi:peptidoglycan/LPS O-acetylase OafA/YrhL